LSSLFLTFILLMKSDIPKMILAEYGNSKKSL
jgi:hypothetical protein